MQLSRARIISAAVELIEREGVDAVSMRRIATGLGSGVMSLYNHVPSKAALLDGVAERVISSIDVTSEARCQLGGRGARPGARIPPDRPCLPALHDGRGQQADDVPDQRAATDRALYGHPASCGLHQGKMR